MRSFDTIVKVDKKTEEKMIKNNNIELDSACKKELVYPSSNLKP